MEDSIFFGGIAALTSVIGLTAIIIGSLAFYIGSSYGLMLLAKKYVPRLRPVLSWIPIVNLYVYARISGKSAWWILGYLVPILNIFVAFYLANAIAQRTGRDVGTMLLLVFFPCIMLPWLGLTVHGKRRTVAWVLGIIGIVATFIGIIGLGSAVITGAISAGTNPVVQAEIVEELKNNPDIQKAMEELKNNPEALEAIQKELENNPELKTHFDAVMNAQANAKINSETTNN